MVYKQVSLNITPAQMRKAAAGKQITLAANQLSGGSMSTYLHPANVEKIMKAKKQDVEHAYIFVMELFVMILTKCTERPSGAGSKKRRFHGLKRICGPL